MTTINFTLLSLHISSLLAIIHEIIVLFGGERRVGGMGNGGDENGVTRSGREKGAEENMFPRHNE